MNALAVSSSEQKNPEAAEELLQLVTLTLGDEEYAVDILKVQEINRMKEITRVPNAPSYVEGVINLRGKVIPVVNLRAKFGLMDKEKDDKTRIMIMDIQGITMGLIVDSVSEVLRIPTSIVEPTPPMASNISSEFIKGIAKLDERLIILLDMDRLLGKSEDTELLQLN
ncbi:MAG: chemotaxis protein CheW [Thermodesulfovibrionales bacterium]|nr:chemotaxis protein CheW [Thermodesulfovibrionales bacterium]